MLLQRGQWTLSLALWILNLGIPTNIACCCIIITVMRERKKTGDINYSKKTHYYNYTLYSYTFWYGPMSSYSFINCSICTQTFQPRKLFHMFLSVAIRSLNIVSIVGRPDNFEQNSIMHFRSKQKVSSISELPVKTEIEWVHSIDSPKFIIFFFFVQNMNSFELQINLLHHWNSKRSHIDNRIDRNVIFFVEKMFDKQLCHRFERKREIKRIF